MGDLEQFVSALKAGTFTFLIGGNEERFEVHAHAVAQHSELLNKMMMNGKMKESKLPSVDPGTFIKFAEYCYYGDYNVLPNGLQKRLDAIQSSKSAISNLVFSVIEFLGARTDESFHCHKCKLHTNMHVNFPYCRPNCDGYSSETTYCTRCGTSAKGDSALLCPPSMSGDSDSMRLNTVDSYMSAVAILQEFQDERLLEYLPTTPDTSIEGHNLSQKQEDSGNLISHAKVFVFAEIYGVPALQKLSVTKLAEEINIYMVHEERIKAVLELIDYVYANTYSDSDGEQSDGDVIRQMVIKLTAKNAYILMKSNEAATWVEQGGEAVLDLVKVIIGVMNGQMFDDLAKIE